MNEAQSAPAAPRRTASNGAGAALPGEVTAAKPRPRFAWLLLIAISLSWGLNWTANKMALQEMSPWTHRAYSCAFGGAGLFLLCRLGGHPWRVPRRDWRMLAITAFLNVSVWQIGLAYAVLMMKAGQAAVLAFTMPLWTVAFSVLILKERLGPRRIWALAMGMAGLAFLVIEGMSEGGAAEPAGIALIVLSAMSWAYGTILVKGYRWSIPAMTLAAWQLVIGGVPALAISVFYAGLDISGASAEAIWALIFTIVIAFTLTYYLWFTAIEIFPASLASIGTLLIPVVGLVGGWLVLNEAITPFDAIAAALIIGGVALAMSEAREPG